MNKQTPHPWTMRASAPSELEILLYQTIGQDFWGDGLTAKAFAEDLTAAGSVSKIHVRINSYGGEVFDGIAIFNTLVAHPAKVTATIDGIAASIASVIAMAADEISMPDTAMMMIHNPWSMAVGDAADMRKMADTLDKSKEALLAAYRRHSSLGDEAISALMDAETWMTAAEAVDKGFAEKTVKGDAAQMVACANPSRFRKMPAALVALATPQSSAATSRETAAQQAPENPTAGKAEEKKPMDEKKIATAAAVEVNADALKTRNEEIKGILELGKKYNVETSDMIGQGFTLAQSKEAICDVVMARAKAQEKSGGKSYPVISMLTDRERDSYSVRRAILALAGEGDAGLETEISNAIAKQLNLNPRANGLYIPTRLNNTGLDTKTDAAGDYTVATQTRELIDMLRTRLRVAQLGATMLPGLSDNVAFPVVASGSAVTWVAENPGSDLSDSDAVFGTRSMSPKMLSATTAFSRKLLAQSSIGIEMFVRGDLAYAHAKGIDAAAINGLGSSNQPKGILKDTDVNVVWAAGATESNGAAPSYADIVAHETALADVDGDEAGMKWLTTPGVRGLLRVTEEFATSNGRPVWRQGQSVGIGEMLGYDAYVSNNVPSTLTSGSATSICHAILFGYWPSLLIGEWGVIELVVDPYRLKKQGMIEITSYQMVDVLCRQPKNFVVSKDNKLS